MGLSQTLSSYKASMMPQGLHSRTLGETKLGKHMQTCTFLQQSVTPVIREENPENDCFELGISSWSPNPEGQAGYVPSVGAHIHGAGWNNSQYRWKFSSAGCQTLPGWVINGRTTANSEYDRFQRLLGIMPVNEDAPDGEESPSCNVHGKIPTNFNDKYCTVYPMVLLSGREARLHSEGARMSDMRRVRIGSSCEEGDTDHPIYALQRKLGVTADGDFGARSVMALIEAQAIDRFAIGLSPDGIITPDLAESMEVDLV